MGRPCWLLSPRLSQKTFSSGTRSSRRHLVSDAPRRAVASGGVIASARPSRTLADRSARSPWQPWPWSSRPPQCAAGTVTRSPSSAIILRSVEILGSVPIAQELEDLGRHLAGAQRGLSPRRGYTAFVGVSTALLVEHDQQVARLHRRALLTGNLAYRPTLGRLDEDLLISSH